MKISKRQLRRIIKEAIDPCELEEPLENYTSLFKNMLLEQKLIEPVKPVVVVIDQEEEEDNEYIENWRRLAGIK